MTKLRDLLPILLIVLIALCIRPTPVEQATSTNTPVVAEDKSVVMIKIEIGKGDEFFRDNIVKVLNEIIRSYPILSLRQLAREFSKRNHYGDIQLWPAKLDINAAGVAAIVEGKKTILLNITYFESIWDTAPRERIEDDLLNVILHETYHLDHHPVGIVVKDGKVTLVHDESKGSSQKTESEAWWWTVKHAIVPQAQAGRITNQSELTTRVALEKYQDANGNPESEVWQSFIATVTAKAVQNQKHPSSP